MYTMEDGLTKGDITRKNRNRDEFNNPVESWQTFLNGLSSFSDDFFENGRFSENIIYKERI